MRLFGPSTGGSNVNATLPIAGSVIDWKTAIDALHAGLDVEVRDYTHENESCHLSRIIEWGRTVILQSDNTTIADNLSFGNAAVSGSQWDSGVSVTIINEGVIENNLISDRDQSIIFLFLLQRRAFYCAPPADQWCAVLPVRRQIDRAISTWPISRTSRVSMAGAEDVIC